jgi:GT2 family glycosyltransferase
MDNNTLIISMTSYPARIEGVAGVWESILNQDVDKRDYHCVLVLAEPEFPDKKLPLELTKLIESGEIELIWYPKNIKSHKKLMPTLAKYPDNPILVVDDDIIRDDGWLQTFIKDHKDYPNDIISGTFQYYLDGNLQFQRMIGFKQAKARGKNQVPGLVLNFARPANGCAGTLYPAHTFTDKRFFDEEKMMELSPTSDESWQYCFNVMKGMTMRQTSVIFDESAGVVPGSQELSTSLYKVNSKKYRDIFEGLFKEFPEFKKEIINRQKKAVISLTSYSARFRVLPVVLDSLVNQTVKLKICLILAENDEKNLTQEIKDFVESGDVEIIRAETDLRPHNKYFYTMMKYPDYAVITVDDDRIYSKDMVETLLRGYTSHPNCVIARRVHKIRYDENKEPLPYKNWELECESVKVPSQEIIATGCGAILYPPSILGISKKNIPEIIKTITADDIYLKHVENIKGIQVFYVGGHKKDNEIKDTDIQRTALYKTNIKRGWNDKYLQNLLAPPEEKKLKIPKYHPKIVHGKTMWTKETTMPNSRTWSYFLK